jgi:putative ABC transport system substrate-binding protein
VKLREFTLAGILALGAVLVAALAAAQQPGKIARVVYLGSDSAPTPATPNLSLQAFRRGLGELGYVDRRDVIIETRWAEGRIEQLPALAAELVGLRVDVIVGVGAVVVRAAKSATTTIPIVMAVVIDPVEAGLVASLERPGGNITGLTTFDPQEAGKKLELLKEVLPGLERVALLADQDIRDRPLKAHEDQARALGLHPQGLKLAGANPDLERVFEAMTRERANALLVLEQPATVAHRRRIAEMAVKHRLPTLFARASVDAGGLIGYGTSLAEASQRMAMYVDKILKGAKPRDLPVEVVVRHELVINVRTAREIGVTIPPEVLKRANQTIQ